jgi:hypothetical protein
MNKTYYIIQIQSRYGYPDFRDYITLETLDEAIAELSSNIYNGKWESRIIKRTIVDTVIDKEACYGDVWAFIVYRGGDIMKYKPEGYKLEIGDRIAVSYGIKSNPFRIDVITRITKTLAICEVEGQQSIRYPNVYGWGFYAKPYERTNIQYMVIDDE